MSSPRQNRPATLVWLLLLISLGSSSVAASVAKTDDLQRSIILRADSPNREIDPRDLGITAEGRRGNIVSVMDTSEAPMSIALVIDAGPNRPGVLNREKEVASSLIAEFSSTRTEFIVIRAGYHATSIATTTAGSMAMSSLQALSAETGKKSEIPIYQGAALAIEELSSRPGIRVLMVIAEGNDSKSGISYKQLLVADHTARSSKAILRYGCDLQSLASGTGGVFLDNDRNTSRTLKRLTQAIRSLRLVTFELSSVSLRRHRMHTTSHSVGRLHVQKEVFIGGSDCECC